MKTNRLHVALLALLPACSCGEDEIIPDTPDAVATTDASDVDAADPTSTVFAVAGDFQAGSGIASAIDVDSLTVDSNVVAGVVSSDPVVRVLDDRVIVVNRFGADNISILDRDGFALIEQVSIGANSNPQDVARANGKIYVSTYSGVGVSIIDESDLASGVSGTVDLSANDPDGNPNCGSIVVANGKLFVSCQLQDDVTFEPRGPGIVVVIDPDTDTVDATLTLANENPFSFLAVTDAASPFGGDVLASTVPDFADYTDGCIERISTGATPAVTGCLIDNDTLGGYVSDMAVSGDELLLTVTTCTGGDCFTNPTTSDVARVTSAGAVAGTLSTASSHPTDLAVCPLGEIIVGDTDYADSPGIRVYASDLTELTSAPLDIGLPPGFTNSISCY